MRCSSLLRYTARCPARSSLKRQQTQVKQSIVDARSFSCSGAAVAGRAFILKVALTLALAVFSTVGPTCRRHEAQLATEHVGVGD